MKRIAFIVQRYGIEVNGGAEYHCRLVAEKLNNRFTVEVLTTCAKDYMSWANEYAIGTEFINGVKVIRFGVEHPRDLKKFKLAGRRLRKKKQRRYHRLLGYFGQLKNFEKLTGVKPRAENELAWIKEQGPYVPELITFLKTNQENYDVLIFFTYLYYPTAIGISVASHKSILIPTAHDEPPIYLEFFRSFFKQPKAILYNTESERRFVNKVFGNEDIYSDVVGVGIDVPALQPSPGANALLQQAGNYIIYIGRIEVAKACDELISNFIKFKASTDNDIKLVFVGRAFMPVTEHPSIIYTGFVDEYIKFNLLKNSRALVIPSIFESLSLVTLESMAYGIPVIANEKCEVIKDHINKSGAGFLYNNQETFIAAIQTAFSNNTNVADLSEKAKSYVAENYTWVKVLEKFDAAVDYVAGHSSSSISQ
ncbi:glycosyltransferase family 4 protein [Mucilaginibacter sp. P25]|uniref:Glycosyl transferases group 1 n=1 Tax=Mucilaginibacter gossypii TaxID=551996 RepID=A0A1G7W7S8_9SPHI|nr:glycosyltransferase family 4 protein [Mucilaginibacter gossypii]SDG68055.1 Glycosyl transferases group 1 [Mucilaginibacter gossypii]